MDANNQEVSDSAQAAISMDALIREHRTLDDEVSELSGRSFLTQKDRLHLARLKKEKLRVKDRIAGLSNVEESA